MRTLDSSGLRTTERHLPYEITQCFLPPDTGKRLTPAILDLPTLEGWKAELTLVAGYIPRLFTCQQTVTHPGSNIQSIMKQRLTQNDE